MSLPVSDPGSLAAAVASGNIKEVKAIFAKGTMDINQRSSDGFAPLCIAAFWGYADIVKLFLDQGADVNVCNKGTGWTACHCAAFQGHGKVMLYLSQAKPDVTLKDSVGRTAVDFGSALDSIWPFFAAMGCTRTNKTDLIRMDIIKKTEATVVRTTTALSVGRNTASHLSRPGSSYTINTQLLQPTKATQMTAALAFGDVLYEDTHSESSQAKTTVNMYRP